MVSGTQSSGRVRGPMAFQRVAAGAVNSLHRSQQGDPGLPQKFTETKDSSVSPLHGGKAGIHYAKDAMVRVCLALSSLLEMQQYQHVGRGGGYWA